VQVGIERRAAEKRFVLVRGARHNDLVVVGAERYLEALSRLLEETAPPVLALIVATGVGAARISCRQHRITSATGTIGTSRP
jgi:hypothetical protein